jgi:hypothetical protein
MLLIYDKRIGCDTSLVPLRELAHSPPKHEKPPARAISNTPGGLSAKKAKVYKTRFSASLDSVDLNLDGGVRLV